MSLDNTITPHEVKVECYSLQQVHPMTPDAQFRLSCVPDIKGNVDMPDCGNNGNEKLYIRVKKDEKIDVNQLWMKTKYVLNIDNRMPDNVYCIMSYDDEIGTPIRMTAFLKLVVQAALHTGAIIFTSGLSRGVTKRLCNVLEHEKMKYKGMCLKNDVYIVAIIAESKIKDFIFCTNEEEKYVTYTYTGTETNMMSEPFDMRHDLFILVEDGDSNEDNLSRTSRLAQELAEYLKKTYTDNVPQTVPWNKNEEREFDWHCDNCGDRIIGLGLHCQQCGDKDLCDVCAENECWLQSHTSRHEVIKFDTWDTRRFLTPGDESKGSWRCSSCTKHIWDIIYVNNNHNYAGKEAQGVFCGNCCQWKEYQRMTSCYSLGEFEGIHLDSTECRPVAVTWFFLQGGESELIAAYNAFRKGIRLLATYGDGGKTAEILAFIATQKSVTENQIKGMVKSTFCDDNTDVDMCVQLLKDILTLNDSKDENHKIITCGIDHHKQKILKNGLIKGFIFEHHRQLRVVLVGLTGIADGFGITDLCLLQLSFYSDDKTSCSSDHATLLLMTLWDINTEDAEYMLENNITKQCISYKTIMMSALVLGKASFLEICLENGMPLQPFCDKTTLGHLYRSVLFYNELIEDDTSLLRLVKRKLNLNKSGNDDLLLCKVADFAARLTRGVFHPNYIDLSEYTPSVKDLYVWALLCGRYEMAKLLWNIAPDHIALALLGSRILRSLSKFASKYEERHLGEDLEEQGIEFENLASNAIQVCYQKDTEKSHKLLHKPICNLNKNHKFTCLTLAWACHAMKFISMSCCQTKLTRIWNQDSGKNGVVEGSVHFLSPKFQFFFNLMMMINMLIVLTTFVLRDLLPLVGIPCISEIIVLVWMFCITIEEIRLISYIDRVGLRRKLISFCFRQWNVIKVTMLALFWISVLARIVVPDNYFVFVRVLYSFTLCASYLNLLPMGFANDKLGPKLVMIRGMVMELFIFLVILLVFIFGYGAMMEALLHPNNPHSKMETLPHLLYKPFFQILGDLLTDEYEGDDIACESLTNEGCIIQVLIPILTGIYVLITNVLLLNLLIAVFSFYIEDIQARSEVVWAFYRYGLIMEYKNKVPFFPFGCLFYWPYLMYKCVSSKCYKQKRYTSVPKSESDYELESFEHRGVNQCWRQVKTEVTS